jgi:hypothetical protein
MHNSGQSALRELLERTEQMIYVEKQNILMGFLPIEPYKKLAASFSNKPPNAAVFGAKGAGKTFLLKILSNLGEWCKFCSICGIEEAQDAVLTPIYWSHNESDEGKKILVDLQTKTVIRINKYISNDKILYNHQVLRTLFSAPEQKLPCEWREMWFKYFCLCLGFCGKNSATYESEFRQRVSSFPAPIVYLCDGLEDLFSLWLFNDIQIEPLRVLIQDIIPDIPLWAEDKFGLLVFIRNDMAQRAVTQNSGQYFSNFHNCEIKWSKEDALRLVGWLLNTPKLKKYRSNQSDKDWHTKDFQSMCKDLIPFWGTKLGTKTSSTTSHAHWILSALCDFNGNFQARDIIRFINRAVHLQMRYAASEDCLISCSVFRVALKECGEEKISEIAQEMKHIASDLGKISLRQPAAPLSLETLEKIGVNSTVALEATGILLREGNTFFLPEIYRKGLGLHLSQGAHSKVATRMKKAWKKACL